MSENQYEEKCCAYCNFGRIKLWYNKICFLKNLDIYDTKLRYYIKIHSYFLCEPFNIFQKKFLKKKNDFLNEKKNVNAIGKQKKLYLCSHFRNEGLNPK